MEGIINQNETEQEQDSLFDFEKVIVVVLHLIYSGLLVFSGYHAYSLVQRLPDMTDQDVLVGTIFMIGLEAFLEVIVLTFQFGQMEKQSKTVGGIFWAVGMVIMGINVRADIVWGMAGNEWAMEWTSYIVPLSPVIVGIMALVFAFTLPSVIGKIQANEANQKLKRDSRKLNLSVSQAKIRVAQKLNTTFVNKYEEYLDSPQANTMMERVAEKVAEQELQKKHLNKEGLVEGVSLVPSGDGQSVK